MLKIVLKVNNSFFGHTEKNDDKWQSIYSIIYASFIVLKIGK